MKFIEDKKITLLFLLLIILLGFLLRIIGINKHLLWQDEAETVINSLQVIEDGYPHGYFKGRPMYETESFIASNNPMYAYESTNYYGSKYEKNKGWLTYYYQAIFLKIFGFSEVSARLPFIGIFIITAYFIFKLASEVYNKKVGLLATFLHAINYFAIFYEKQSRYYALEICLVVLCLYFYYLALKNNKFLYYLLTAIFLIALFHVHIISSLVLVIFMIFYKFLQLKNIKKVFDKNLLFLLFVFLLFSIPWLFLVNFWINFKIYSNEISKKLYWIGAVFVFILAYIFITRIFLNLIFKIQVRIKSTDYLLICLITFLFLKPLITPEDSFATRLFVALLAIFAILIAKVILDLIREVNPRNVFYMILILLFFLTIPISKIPTEINRYGSADWVKQAIQYLNDKNVSKDTLILVAYNQLPFWVYSDYNIQIIWPVRLEYIKQYNKELIMILDKYCPYQDNICEQLEYFKYFERLKKFKGCQEANIVNEIYAYHCPVQI